MTNYFWAANIFRVKIKFCVNKSHFRTKVVIFFIPHSRKFEQSQLEHHLLEQSLLEQSLLEWILLEQILLEHNLLENRVC